jgi:uncharacterized protein (DUF885 family)
MNPTDTAKTFNGLCEEFVELYMKYQPVEATAAGIHDYDGAFGDDSPAGLQERAAWLRDLEQRVVTSVRWESLPLEQRVDYGLLRSRIAALRADLEEIKVYQRNPAFYPDNALQGVFLLLAREFAPLEERKEPILSRLNAIPAYLDAAHANLGRVPELFVRVATEVSLSGPIFVDEVVRALLRRFPGEAERIEHAGARARLGFIRYQERLERELKGKVGGALGIGERWMNYKLEREHLLSYDCDGLAELGREHVQRTRVLLEREAGKLAAGRDWRELIAEAKRNHPTALRLREAYESEVERARRFVADRGLAPMPADARLEIIDTPLFERHTIPYAAYLAPAPYDVEQVGYLYVTPADPTRPREEQEQQLQGHNYASIPLTALHETYPGHHLQLCLANKAGSHLRHLVQSTLFAEGWALYCEELMHEQGFFSGPATRLYQLRDLLWRACRVVIDVELQRGRMSFEQAVDFLVRNVVVEPVNAEAEIKRYALTPTHPLSYLVGKLQILELRAEAERRLGSRFGLGDFHGALLASGTLPPTLVGEELSARLA